MARRKLKVVKRGKRKTKKFEKSRKEKAEEKAKQTKRDESKPSSDDKPSLPASLVFSRPKSQNIVSQLAANIAEGNSVDPDYLAELRKSIPDQSAKIDVLMQAVAAHQSKRLSKYLEAAGFTEQLLFHPEIMTRLAPKDLLRLFELIQKHMVQITEFIEGKSSSPPVPELVKQLLNLDTSKKQEVSESRTNLEKLDSFSRERIRNTVGTLLKELRDIEKGKIVDAKLAKPNEPTKKKNSKLGRISKEKRRKAASASGGS